MLGWLYLYPSIVFLTPLRIYFVWFVKIVIEFVRVVIMVIIIILMNLNIYFK